jgi:hypothetical protein
MPSSGILRRVDLVRTDLLEEYIASIFRVKLLSVTLVVSENIPNDRRGGEHLERATRLTEGSILHCYRHENIRS